MPTNALEIFFDKPDVLRFLFWCKTQLGYDARTVVIKGKEFTLQSNEFLFSESAAAKRFGVSRDVIRRYVKDLSYTGFVKTLHTMPQSCYILTMLDENDLQDPSYKNPTPVATRLPQTSYTPSTLINNNIKETTPRAAAPAHALGEYLSSASIQDAAFSPTIEVVRKLWDDERQAVGLSRGQGTASKRHYARAAAEIDAGELQIEYLTQAVKNLMADPEWRGKVSLGKLLDTITSWVDRAPPAEKPKEKEAQYYLIRHFCDCGRETIVVDAATLWDRTTNEKTCPVCTVQVFANGKEYDWPKTMQYEIIAKGTQSEISSHPTISRREGQDGDLIAFG